MTFYHRFILSCFQENQEMRVSTLYHLLKGKRTSSILSYAYFYELLSCFALFPKLNEKQHQKTIDYLIEQQLLIEESGYARLSEKGQQVLNESTFPEKNHLNQLSFYKWDMAFFERLLFVTQVLSEKAHLNLYYVPIESNLFKQQQLKRWLLRQSDELVLDFYKEWQGLTSSLSQKHQELLLGQLVGHEHIGFTLNQLAERYQVDYLYNYLEFKNVWHQVIQLVLDDKIKYPLFFELLEEERRLKKEDSSLLSAILFQEYKSIELVARKRQLKESTVTDHLIEEFILIQDNSKIPNFSDKIKKELTELQNNKPDFLRWTYKEALSYSSELSFYEFKFYQFYLIEKERQND